MTHPSTATSAASMDRFTSTRRGLAMSSAPRARGGQGTEQSTNDARWWRICDRAAARLASAPRARHRDMRERLADYLNALRKQA